MEHEEPAQANYPETMHASSTGNRFVIIGASGSGKTTFAQQLANQLSCPHIELDSLHWLPDWKEAPWDEIRPRVKKLLAQESWVCDGNYSHLRDIVWQRADTIIWLNFPFPFVFFRLLRRTFIRAFGKVELWNGNRENLRTSFFSSDSILLWLIKSYPRHLREYPQLFAMPEYAHLHVLRFQHPSAADAWLHQQQTINQLENLPV